MLKQILKTIRRYRMFETGERVVAAVSGGPDSVALLCALDELKARFCLKVYVAHLDHGVRRGSARDLAFVKKLAQQLDLPFFAETIHWKKEKRSGSLEDALRNLRYDFLFRVAKKNRASKIVLGHTKDDQAETVLMRILRGSGLHGLSAILPRRSVGPFVIVRPLIEVGRKDVIAFLKKRGIPYRTDATNRDEKFMRNKIRHSLLPLLEKDYNPGIKEVLSNLALLSGADYGYLQAQAQRFLKKNFRCSKETCSVDLIPFRKLDISLQRFVLRSALEALRGDLRRLTFRHWQEVDDLVFRRPVASEVHLPGDITVSKTRDYLNIFKR